ncbi:MAG: type II secretion system protein [Phycisphaerales bacterium]|jgi:type II secretory pathway pseudopilin PulG
MRRRQRAFTLTETLVVMGVIVLLVGLLMPAISKIQAESRSTGCLSNLRQLFGGIEANRQQNNSLLPNTEPLPALTAGGPIGGLPSLLKSFIDRESPVWICPADNDPDSYEIGTSYIYLPGLYVLTPEIQLQLPPNALLLPPKERKELEARVVTTLYESNTNTPLPLLMDSQERHFIGDRVPRNGLYIDGSARIVAKPSPNTAVD